ncbi:MAG: hypothetical protein GY899_02925 [Verrucomicrobiaceae bacterium]|nr:hypothetical protein [Verrucomicrobiaceae bacterium]
MSKSSSSSDPVEFQFELDIGEDVPSPATEPPEKTEPEAQVDDPGDYVILKRKARKGKPKKLDPGKAQTDKGQTSSGREQEAGSSDFMPRKLDGGLVVENPDPAEPSALSHEVEPVRKRLALEGIGKSRDSRNRIAGARGILNDLLSLCRSYVGRLKLVRLQSNKVIMAIFLTVTIMGVALWILFPEPEDEGAVQGNAKQKQEKVIAVVPPTADPPPPEKAPVLLMKSQSGESDAQRDLRARDSLGKFFSARNQSEMLPLIRDSERVRPLIEDYYSRYSFVMPGVSKIVRFQEIMINLKIFLIADIVLEGKGANTVVLQDAGEGFVVDWETYVCYNPMAWEDFYRKRPGQAMSLRVLATLDHNPGFAFPGEAEWVCVRMIGRDSEEELYGYVRTGSQTALRIQEMLEDEWEFPCILQLQFPEDGKGGDRQVHIKGLVMENWINVD